MIVVLLAPTRIFAQPGVKAGTTISTFLNSNEQMDPYLGYDIDLSPYLGYDIKWVQLNNQKPLISPYVSIYYNFQVLPRMAFRPEVSYAQKGVNFNQNEYQLIIYKVKINYIEIPLSVSYCFIQKEKLLVDVFTGGFGAIKLNAFKKTKIHTDNTEKTEIQNVQTFDAGIHLGFNSRYKINSNFILFEIRYFLGLSNLFHLPENQTDIYNHLQNIKLTGFNISLGYEF